MSSPGKIPLHFHGFDSFRRNWGFAHLKEHFYKFMCTPHLKMGNRIGDVLFFFAGGRRRLEPHESLTFLGILDKFG